MAAIATGLRRIHDQLSVASCPYRGGWAVNFGRSYGELFFEVYGIEPDPERIRIHRQLWDRQ